jgi:hypothetical protein
MRCARTSVLASLVAQEGVGVLAGIDTHKDTLAVAAIDDVGRPVVVTNCPPPRPASTPSSS